MDIRGCGEKTCAREPGKFCRFLATTHFGTHYVCRMYGDREIVNDSNGDGTGWLLRLEECLTEPMEKCECCGGAK